MGRDIGKGGGEGDGDGDGERQYGEWVVENRYDICEYIQLGNLSLKKAREEGNIYELCCFLSAVSDDRWHSSRQKCGECLRYICKCAKTIDTLYRGNASLGRVCGATLVDFMPRAIVCRRDKKKIGGIWV